MKKKPPVRLTLPTIRAIFFIAALCIISIGIGYWFGQNNISLTTQTGSISLTNKNPDNRNIDFALFWDVWDRLERNYIDDEKLDKQKMVWGAIKGMTAALGDPYTVYLPPEQNEVTREELNGSFEGIGAQLGMKDERIVVVAPLKGLPAEIAGIRTGDIIAAVDGVDTYGWTVPEAVDRIRGEKGTVVKLTVFHEGDTELTDIEITRDTIDVPTAEVKFKDNVAILSLYQFNEQTVNQWNNAINEIIKTCGNNNSFTCDGVVVDLRNNPGGFLENSVFVVSEFLKDGIVVKQEYANGRQDKYPVNRTGKLLSVPLVVLVNKGSASASEIVAGALKVSDRATIVGETTFGKGTIQERQELSDKSGLHITVAKWVLSDDSWINEIGVSPDVEIADDKETTDVDEQLEEAISSLKQE